MTKRKDCQSHRLGDWALRLIEGTELLDGSSILFFLLFCDSFLNFHFKNIV